MSGTTVTAVSAGQCEVAADQAGGTGTNGYLYGAATEVTKTILVGTPQTITFGAVTPSIVPLGTSAYFTTTVSSGLTPTVVSSTPGICTVVSTTDYGSYAEIIIQGVSGGSCLLTANQPGNAQYLPAPQASLSVPVGIAQTITFDTYPVAIHANIVETLVATASSGLPVTFTSVENNNGECRISGNQLTQISYSAGATCSVTASQAGNAQYAPAASVTVKIPVGGGEVITFSGYPSSLSGPGSTGTLTATVSNSGLTVTFSSLTPSICTVSGD